MSSKTLSFFQFSIAFTLECRYQRERLAAPWPWPDTAEHRKDWLSGVLADFVEFIEALDEPSLEPLQRRSAKVSGRQPTNDDNDCG